jgi:aspartyl-tRNA synthetase
MNSPGEQERTCHCGLIKEGHVDETVTVMGWVDRRRDLGSLIFLDLRDREGIVQVVANPEQAGALAQAKEARPEDVLAVTGKVVWRDEETVNPEIPTGRLEIRAEVIELLNASETPPFPINSPASASEETRLRFRFLDLRRERLQRNLQLRHRASLEIRKFLDEEGFLEIETPFLTRSTPEGARDYLVPSRLYPGQFYALPQSPQLFKQLLMVSGFDRYFQIVRCFRDEDLRSDRQPEFTQVDLEVSFPQIETLFQVVERLFERVFSLAGISISTPFQRLSYAEALSQYGTDRPDLRYDLKLGEVSTAFSESSFQVFRQIIEEGGLIKGIRVPGRASYSRKQLDDLRGFVQDQGMGADLSWIKVTAEGIKSSLPKAVDQAELEAVKEAAQLEENDLFLMLGGPRETVHLILGRLREHLARQENLIPEKSYEFLWVSDFPLLQWDEQEKRYFACHHPFTSPLDEDLDLLESDPARVRAKAYDVVLNGVEIGGGSIRIHRREVQTRVFKALGIGPEEAESKFGFLLEALKYGAPPHGGIALGLDRIIMLLAGEHSLRDVIAFPKTARAVDLMCGAPSTVSEKQLRELGLKLQGGK